MPMIALPPAQLSERYAWKAPNPSRAVLQHLCVTRKCSPCCATGSPPAVQGAWVGNKHSAAGHGPTCLFPQQNGPWVLTGGWEDAGMGPAPTKARWVTSGM